MITPYYTKAISEEATKALHEVDFPFPIADMGFAVPQIVKMPVDYASVFDWLLEKGFEINIGFVRDTDKTFGYIRKNGKLKDREPFHAGLLETFDKLILLAVEFLKSEKDDNA